MPELTHAAEEIRPEILLVDDDQDVLVTLGAVLRAEGYTVTSLGHFSAALDAIQTHDFDLLLTDLRLDSAGEGLSLVVEARQRNPYVAAIILTGYADVSSTIEALRLGVSNYLVKPCEMKELKLAVALALEQAARRRAEDAVRTRDDLISAAVHDLKNPLAAIRGWATLVERRAREHEGADERMGAGLAQLQSAARRMESLVDELLEVAQLEMGHIPQLDRRPTDLAALASRVISEHQQGTTTHRLVLRATNDPVVGRWDAVRLERVLGNLLSNAIKYTPHGGVITISVARSSEERATLAVSDQGVGIPPGDVDRIFDAFQRGENVPESASGKGVGLRYVKRIVEEHGGTVGVESEEGRGSTFTIVLPLEPPDVTGDR